MAWTYTYDTGCLLGSSSPTIIDDQMNETLEAIAERMAIDHDWTLAAGVADGTDVGKHTKITFVDPLGADPANVADQGFLYTKDVSTKAELFWEDEDANVKQITSGGQLLIAANDFDTTAVDDSTIEINGSGKLAIKDDGVGADQLGDGVADSTTITISAGVLSLTSPDTPSAGADLYPDDNKIAEMAWGYYTSDGTETTIKTGTTIRWFKIIGVTVVGESIEAVVNADGDMYIYTGTGADASAQFSISGDTVTLAAAATYCNVSGRKYYWIALGEWA